MIEAGRITEVAIATKATKPREPLTATMKVYTVNAVTKFELTEDLAHRICTELERFLTR